MQYEEAARVLLVVGTLVVVVALVIDLLAKDVWYHTKENIYF